MKDDSVNKILNIANLEAAEDLYAKYVENPSSVDESWQQLFKELNSESTPHSTTAPAEIDQECRIKNVINGYRRYGHLLAKINPIVNADDNPPVPYELKLETLGFTDSDLNEFFPTCQLLNEKQAKLSKIIDHLKSIYSDKIGIEYMGLQNPELEKFIQEQMESIQVKAPVTIAEKHMILKQLNKSELLEVFLHTKYVGQKRFSLEGGETLIPMLEAIIETGASIGIEEFFIGMSHRGRLNVLTNILNKSYTDVFSEFDESYIPNSFEGSGDVKYHKGFSSEIKTAAKIVKVTLTPNPSHLESVDPVVEGQAKARQEMRGDNGMSKVIPILVHGDAAISGQGVVYETLQFCRLPGYATGGTLHLVVNNKIGFTTIPRDLRSTLYCTDIAKTFGSPVFHVNVEDPETCVFATNLSLQIRQKFHLDVFIDLICYRKYGHNETDEPAFTQPLEYQIIRKKRPIREIYRDQLIQNGFLEKELAEKLETEFKESLLEAKSAVNVLVKEPSIANGHENGKIIETTIKTSVSKELLLEVTTSFCRIPEGFNIHPKVSHLIKNQLSMITEGKNIDWGMAETLAYAVLLWQHVNIRISGQDSCRGTFSHRHGLWVDQVKEQDYFPLKHLKASQGKLDLINSPLSEYAVLGFEYGYNIMTIDDLSIWEAQFGDFVNGAQITLDQYLASAESKWGQKSSLVLLLPHGFEGQGPEHSSGRIERFLASAGNDNIQIVNPTTPAQFFHLIQRQVLGKIHKPLIVFSPKGLLRHPECVSRLADFESGEFQTVIQDVTEIKNPKRLIFCSGRVYYDLMDLRNKNNVKDVAIVRIEQLYPLDTVKIKQIIDSYKELTGCYYVQEEPSNMGAFDYLRPVLTSSLNNDLKLTYVGRKRSASPATGSHALHRKEYANIMAIMKGEIL